MFYTLQKNSCFNYTVNIRLVRENLKGEWLHEGSFCYVSAQQKRKYVYHT